LYARIVFVLFFIVDHDCCLEGRKGKDSKANINYLIFEDHFLVL
jgi:hypothetical protein